MIKFILLLALIALLGCAPPYTEGWSGYLDGKTKVKILKLERGFWVQSIEGEDPYFVPQMRLHYEKYADSIEQK